MKRFAPLVVALALVVAGCTGPASTGPTEQSPVETTGTATPTDSTGTPTEPITATPTATPTKVTPAEIPEGTLAPGVTDEGVQNLSRLLDAHVATLRERGFAFTVTRTSDGSTDYRVESHARATASLDRLRTNASYTIDGNRTVQEGWLNETMTRMLVRMASGDETRYRIPPYGAAGSEGRTQRAPQVTQATTLERMLDGGDYEVTEATETDGQTRYTLVASNFSANSVYSDQTARLTVGTDGALYAVNVTGELSSGAAFAYEFDLTQVGVEAVERPDWVADAPAPVDTRPTVGFENCSKPYLTLDNPGPDAVPSGTVVEATLDGTTYSVTLDESVAAEGRVAIYLDASETLQTAPIGDVPANRTAMPKEGQFTVVTGEGMLLSQGAGGFGCSSAGDGNGNGESDGS